MAATPVMLPELWNALKLAIEAADKALRLTPEQKGYPQI